ncbi:MAG: hypothetical protein M3133_06605, partial [Actinomycetota bacterium]|nr:hypothetical protein [Actinomycetota bacterium]
ARGRPDDSLARLMLQVYSPGALNQPQNAVRAAEIVAESEPTAQAYVQLVQYAALAGQTRKADLAAQRAIDLAPREQKAAVRAAVKQAKNPQAQAGVQGQ